MSARTGAVISEQTFGETVADAFGVPFALAADGKWHRADASDPLLSLGDVALCIETSVAADGTGSLLKYGYIQRTGWTWTLGQPVYFGATPGTLTQTKPAGNTIRYAGYPAAADALWFSPTDPILAEYLSLELPPGTEGDYLYHNGVAWTAHPLDPLPEGTQGDLLYHNGTAWAVLNPDTAGKILQTGGPGANPAWADLPDGLHRNAIINGNFDIWQRGASIPHTTHNMYVADRWRFACAPPSPNGSWMVSRQEFSPDEVNQYTAHHFLRLSASTPSTDVTWVGLGQLIENGCRWLSGKIITVSWIARSNTPITANLRLTAVYGTGGSPSPVESTPYYDWGFTSNDVNTWIPFSVTYAIPPSTGKTFGTNGDDYILFQFGNLHRILADAGTLDIAKVQLNIGDKPLPFAPRPIEEELALCQRYYRKWTQQTENGRIYVPLWPPMRVAPTMTASTGTISNITAAGFNLTHNAQAATTITASSEL